MSCFSGDWVRTHDERSAALFVAERAMLAQREEAHRERARRFSADVRRRVRSWLRRS